MKNIIYTFGCKVNQAESDNIIKELKDYDTDNLVIINSCSITSRAEQKCRQFINRELKKGHKVVLTGCYIERDFNDLKNKYPDIYLLPNIDKPNIIKKLKLQKKQNKKSIKLKTRAFLKIQDGCQNFCSYCIVPFVRPVVISKPIEKIKEEVEANLDLGYKEIVLTGIKVGFYDYTDNFGTNWDIVKIIELFKTHTELKRIRISSIEPREITNNLIDILPDICPHLHIPIQSGDNDVLHDMNRGYDIKFVEHLVNKLKKKIPNLRITSDIIIGFPTENRVKFNNTIKFIKELDLDGLHIFPFSKRPKTKAFEMKYNITKEELEERKEIIKELDLNLRINSAKKYLNRELEILVEGNVKGEYLEGLTDNYIKVRTPYRKDLINKIITVKPVSIDKTWPVKIIHKNNSA